MKKMVIPIIAGVVLIIGIILFLLLKKSDSYFNISIMESIGNVKVDRDGNTIDAYEGMKMRDKDTIKVLADGFSRINCDRETYSRFEHDTVASFIADSDKKLTINLLKGEMVVEVQKKYSPDEYLNIRTPNTTMAIRGTVVAIRTYPTEDGGYRTINYVLEGRADIQNLDGSEQSLGAGEGWLTVTDHTGNVTKSQPSFGYEFEFDHIDVNQLRGADDTPMSIVTYFENGVNGNDSGTTNGNSAISELSDPEINEANFPDPIFRQFVSDNIDIDKDGILSGDERKIDSIKVPKMKIESLKGIEYFPDLEILYCNQNNLTSLDVSHNKVLRILECQENQLSELDVSSNLELVNLVCGENNLTSIDISKNLKLGEINIKKNKLTSLDTSANTELAHIRIDHNNISSLDLSNNPHLKDLFCLKNKFTSIDVSKNPELVYFDIGSNDISEIDVSNNVHLRQFTCYANKLTSLDLSNNTELWDLKCDQNELTELDLSKNTAITSISCNGNKLTGLDLSQNPNLNWLSCKNNQIATLDLRNKTINYLLYDEDTTELLQ